MEDGTELRLHRRQFVVGPEPFRADETWIVAPLDESSWLSHSPVLRVQWVTDGDGGRWALLGLAVQTLESEPDPAEQLAAANPDTVQALYAAWAGRWLLLGAGEAHLDAGGLLGCLYAVEDGVCWASSSAALLTRAVPKAATVVDRRPLPYDLGVGWVPPPRTRSAGVARLLPSQVLRLRTGEVVARRLVPALDPGRDQEEALDLLAATHVTALRRLPHDDPLSVSLSAGADSRTVLAAAVRAGVEYEAFTWIASRTAVVDRLLPPRLAAVAGCRHRFVRGGAVDAARRALAVEHTAALVGEGDAEPFARGLRDELRGVAANGTPWPVVQGRLRRLGVTPLVRDAEAGTALVLRTYGEPASSSAADGMRAWFKWVLENPEENVDWRDRFVIEQHLAGWGSPKEQLYDLQPAERFAPVNSALNYSLLIGLPAYTRDKKRTQRALVERLAPTLLREPFNPPASHFALRERFAVRGRDFPADAVRRLRLKARRFWRYQVSAR